MKNKKKFLVLFVISSMLYWSCSTPPNQDSHKALLSDGIKSLVYMKPISSNRACFYRIDVPTSFFASLPFIGSPEAIQANLNALDSMNDPALDGLTDIVSHFLKRLSSAEMHTLTPKPIINWKLEYVLAQTQYNYQDVNITVALGATLASIAATGPSILALHKLVVGLPATATYFPLKQALSEFIWTDMLPVLDKAKLFLMTNILFNLASLEAGLLLSDNITANLADQSADIDVANVQKIGRNFKTEYLRAFFNSMMGFHAIEGTGADTNMFVEVLADELSKNKYYENGPATCPNLSFTAR